MFDISIDKRTNVLYNHKYKQMFWFWIKEEFTMKMKIMLKKRFATLFFLIVMAFPCIYFRSTKALLILATGRMTGSFLPVMSLSPRTLCGDRLAVYTPEYTVWMSISMRSLYESVGFQRIYPGQLILIPYYADAPVLRRDPRTPVCSPECRLGMYLTIC